MSQDASSKPTGALTDSQFWDSYWQEGSDAGPSQRPWADQFWERPSNHDFHKVLAPIVESAGYETFLDVGIGDGLFSLYFSQTLGLTGVGIDISPVAVQRGQALMDANQASVKVELRELAAVEDTFDIVYAGGLIEHFRDYDEILQQMIDRLRPGGLLANFYPYLSPVHRVGCKLFARDVLDTHRPISRAEIETSYKNLGLTQVSTHYAGLADIAVLPHVDETSNWLLRLADRARAPVRSLLLSGDLPPQATNVPWLSPFLIALGKKG